MALIKCISESEGQTRRLAAGLAAGLEKNDCLALVGDFGSGKTTFVKGLAKGLACGKKDYVCSPSFVILKIYSGRVPVYHFDLYRLRSERDAEAVGLFEFINAGGIAVIEWPEKVLKLLPAGSLKVRFIVRGEKRRELHFSSQTARHRRAVKKSIICALKK